MSYNIVVRFPDDMCEPLRQAAIFHERSINWIVQAAVADWLDAQPMPIQAGARYAGSASDVPPSPTVPTQRATQAAGAERDQ